MTRKISVIIGVAVAALTVGVPTAFGEGRLAGSPEPDAVAFFKANEMATIGQSVPTGLTTASMNGYREAGERAVPISEAPVVRPIDSGNQLEWPQIGVAFGVGILLAVGLVLTFRHMRIRPLAH